MSKLLAANFARLKKDKPFWICIIYMAAFAAFIKLSNYFNMKEYGYVIPLDSAMFTYCMFIGILLAVFISLFAGTEYSDGTIRNKLIVGHTRTAIYLSNLLICGFAGLMMCLSFIAASLIVGIPLLGFFESEVRVFLILAALSFLMSLAFTSLIMLVSMLKQSRAVAAVINILGVLILLFAAAYIQARLEEPEYYDAYAYESQSGEFVQTDKEPNPNYLKGTKREVYEFFLDFLPSGQTIQLSQWSAHSPVLFAVSSVVIYLAATGIGVLAFNRKDIK